MNGKDVSEVRMRSKTWLGMIGIILAISTPILQKLMIPWCEQTFRFPLDRLVSLLVFWVVLITVLVYSIFVDGFLPAAFGFRRENRPLRVRLIEWITAVLAAVAAGAVLIFFSQYVRKLLNSEPPPALELVRMLPWWVLIPAWLTGSFTEEVLFRSYPIERLTAMTGRRRLAAACTLLAFSLMHLLSWDWIHVLTAVFPGAVLLTLLYLWKRSLSFVVIVHAVINAPLLLLPLLVPYI